MIFPVGLIPPPTSDMLTGTMKVNDELYVLELPLSLGADVRIMNVSLIRDPEHGLTIVDTGIPGQIDLIEEAVKKEGFELSDIKQIVLTHQDLDHIGSLAPLKEKTGATVYAYGTEIPYIEGRLTPIKMPPPERLEANPEMAERMKHFRYTTVDVAVKDGDVLEKSAGAVIVATPGHTPGHMALYLPASKLIIAGDSMISENGVLSGPSEGWATPDHGLAMKSVKSLVGMDIGAILCYHGGLVTDDAAGQLKRVAG